MTIIGSAQAWVAGHGRYYALFACLFDPAEQIRSRTEPLLVQDMDNPPPPC